MRMINRIMERIKRNVRMYKDTPQYIIEEDVPGNFVATLVQQTQLTNNLSPTINELGKKLLQAAQDGDVEEIRQLLAKGAPFTADWLGTSPLHLAAQNNHLEVCEIFLRAGMCKDTRTKVERTPLHMAVYEGNYEIVECLLKHGADADAKDMLHMTPLHWAAQNGHAEIAASLIRYGATVNVQNKFELTPLDIALQEERHDIVEVINFTIRDPLQATNQLMEINESNDAVLQLNMQEESNTASDIPIETVLTIDSDTSQEYLQNQQIDDTNQHEAEEVQYVETIEPATANFTESMKILQQHGITMLPDDESNILSSVMETGHSVVLTEAGKQALNSIKAEKLMPEAAQPVKTKPNLNLTNQPLFKKKKIITVTADQFLAMTTNNSNSLRIVNGKLVQNKPPPVKRVAPQKKILVQTVRPAGCNNPVITKPSEQPVTVSTIEAQLIEQLTKARGLAEAYKKRLIKTELELQKYKQKCKLLMDQNNLNM